MEQPTQDQAYLIREVGMPLYQSKGWLKLLGILSIVQGILAAITIFGIIFAWLPIWLGVLLYQASTTVERAEMNGDKRTFIETMSKLKLYFTIQGVFTLISIVIAIFSFIFVFSFGIIGTILESMP